jgi:hypothetical protein
MTSTATIAGAILIAGLVTACGAAPEPACAEPQSEAAQAPAGVMCRDTGRCPLVPQAVTAGDAPCGAAARPPVVVQQESPTHIDTANTCYVSGTCLIGTGGGSQQ